MLRSWVMGGVGPLVNLPFEMLCCGGTQSIGFRAHLFRINPKARLVAESE